MANSIAYRKNYTDILDRVYQKAACSTVLNSPARMARAGRNAKEIMIPKISVTGLVFYAPNMSTGTTCTPSSVVCANSPNPTTTSFATGALPPAAVILRSTWTRLAHAFSNPLAPSFTSTGS